MKNFRMILLTRFQKTVLVMLKPSFLTWVVGNIFIITKTIPCNGPIEYGLFSASLICSVAVYKRFAK